MDPNIHSKRHSEFGYFQPSSESEQKGKGAEESEAATSVRTLTLPQFEDSIFWKPWTWQCIRTIQHLWAALKFLFFPSPLNNPALDQALYAEVLLGSTEAVQQPIPGSMLLKHMHSFLSHEPGMPPNLLDQLGQTQRWLAQIEKTATTSPQQRARVLEALARTLKQKIENLPNGDSFIMPGGVPGHFAIYRIGKEENKDSYFFEVISRDSNVQGNGTKTAGYKQKLQLGAKFSNIQQGEMTSEWLHALLELQVVPKPSTKELAAGEVFAVSDISALNQVLADKLKSRPSSEISCEGTLGFHKKLAKDRGVAAVWSLFLDSQQSPEGKAVRKVRRQLHTLTCYAISLDRVRTITPWQKAVFLEAIKRLSQKIAVMRDKSQIDGGDLGWITIHVQSLEKRLEERLKGSAPSERMSFSEKSVFPPFTVSPLPQAQGKKEEEQKISLERERPPKIEEGDKKRDLETSSTSTLKKVDVPRDEEDEKELQSMPFSSGRVYARPPELSFDSRNPSESLGRLIKQASELSSDPYRALYFLKDAIFSIPDLHAPCWTLLPSEQRIEASGLILQLARQLKEAIIKTSGFKNILPYQLLAFYRIHFLLENLARLNSAITGFTESSFTNLALDAVLVNHEKRLAYRLRMPRETRVAVDMYHYWYTLASTLGGGIDYLDDRSRLLRGPRPPASTQRTHLIELRSILKAALGDSGREGMFENSYELSFDIYKLRQRKLNDWGTPIREKAFQAIALEFSLETTRTSFTEEAVMDDPAQVIKTASKGSGLLVGPLDDPIKSKEKARIKELSLAEVQGLLLSIDAPYMIEGLMDLIQQHPSLLKNNEVRNLYDFLLLNNSIHIGYPTRTSSNSMGFDPKGTAKKKGVDTEDINSFFTQMIERYEKQGEIELALYLIHLSESWRRYTGEGRLKDYTPHIKKWLMQSLHEDSSLAPHRYALVREYLVALQSKETLDQEELKDLVKFYCYFQSLPEPPSLSDPLLEDEIHQGMNWWEPKIKEVLLEDDSFRDEVLNEICSFHNIAVLKSGVWTGTFPQYEQGNVRVDLLTGDILADRSSVLLPKKLFALPFFKAAFPEIGAARPEVISTRLAGGSIQYAFQSMNGVKMRVVVGNEVSFYRKHPERESWLQAVSIDPTMIKGIPECVASQQFYMPTDNLRELILLDQSGAIQFQFQLASLGSRHTQHEVQGVIDRRGGERPAPLQLSRLNVDIQPKLAALLSFEPAEQILLWRQREELTQIEFYRYGLVFQQEQGQWKCVKGQFKNYTLDLKATAARDKGMVAGLHLSPPEGAKGSVYLIPYCSGKLAPITRISPVVAEETLTVGEGGIVEIAPHIPYITERMSSKAFLKEFNINRAGLLTPVTPTLTWFQSSDGPVGYWVVNENEEGHLTSRSDESSKKSADMWFDLLLYGIVSTQSPNSDPYPLIKQARSRLKEQLTMQPLDKHRLEAMHQQLVKTVNNLSGIKTGPYAESVALALSTLLLIRQHAPIELREKLDLDIGKLAIQYFTSGKHIVVNVALTAEEVNLCSEILERSDQKPRESLQDQPVSSENFFQKRKVTLLRDVEGSVGEMQRILKETRKTKRKPLIPFCKSEKVILDTFEQYYSVLRSGPVTAREKFSNLHLTLKALPAGHGPMTDFLLLLFDLRQENEDFRLPEFPQLKYPTSSRDSGSYTKEKEGDKQVADFFQTLIEEVSKFHKEVAEERREVPEEVEGKTFAAGGFLGSVDSRKTEEVEEKEKQEKPLKKTRKLSFSKSTTPDQLLSKRDWDVYFREVEEKEADSESERIGERRGRYQVIPEKEKDLIKHLQGLSKECHAEACAKMQTIQSLMVEKSKDPILRKAGYVNPPTWEELREACLQDDLVSCLTYRGLKMTPEEILKLKEYVIEVVQLETKEKFALYCVGQIEGMLHAGALDSEVHQRIYQLCTLERQYDPMKSPQLLSVEDTVGGFITEEQIKIICNLVSETGSIQQASTGSGKTSVILALGCLLLADGSNLVTLKCPEALYAENLRQIRSTLGAKQNKKIFAFRYASTMPLQIRFEKNGRQVEESAFQHLYQELEATIEKRGVVVTNRRTFPLLELKWIALLNQFSHSETPPSEMERAHIYWLGKILKLMRQKQHSVFDEYDKLLDPKDLIQLQLGGVKKASAYGFMISGTLRVLDTLLDIPELGLKQNIQADLPEKLRQECRYKASAAIAAKWAKVGSRQDKSCSKEEMEKVLCDYFSGGEGADDDLVLERFEKIYSAEQLDEIALTKELFQVFLPIVLSKKGNKKYILSPDGESVIPCICTDVPREGSEIEELHERMLYHAIYYQQKGVSSAHLKKWLDGLVRQAAEEQYRSEGRIKSLDHTPTGEWFRKQFPEFSMETVSKKSEELLQNLNDSPKKIRWFLRRFLSEMTFSSIKGVADAHTQASMSAENAGVSATLGPWEALPRPFKKTGLSTEKVEKAGLKRLEKRIQQEELLTYDPSEPSKVVPELLKQEPKAGILIDGAGALSGVPPEKVAEQLLTEPLQAVGFFDNRGLKQVYGIVPHEQDLFGYYFSHAQTRGADQRLSSKLKAVLTAVEDCTLEEFLQHVGRLRQPGFLRIAVPKTLNISTVGQVIRQKQDLERRENQEKFHRSKLQEFRDIIRNGMIESLLARCIDPDDLTGCLKLFEDYNDHEGFLITNKAHHWERAGSYYAMHKKIKKQDTDPIKQLTEVGEKMLGLSKELDFPQEIRARVQQELEVAKKLELDSVRDKLPTGVYANQIGTDQEAEVEVEAETETETEAEMETESSVDEAEPVYLKWLQTYDTGYTVHEFNQKLHRAYDANLRFTENFLPLNRTNYAARMHHRVPHQHNQKRLRYIHFQRENGTLTAKVVDLKEAGQIKAREEGEIYNTIRRKAVVLGNSSRYRPPGEAEKLRFIVQCRFEDGQYEGYTKEEVEQLKKWIQEAVQKGRVGSLKELEEYFVKEVLKNRSDKQKYPFSQLRKIFDSLG